MHLAWWREYKQRFRPFTEAEAWVLFRLAAFAEAIGWSLLICGLLAQKFIFNGSNVPVLITGQIHGTIFLAYIAAAILLYPSLGWSRGRAIIAGLASIPPYGSLVMERWAAYHRENHRIRDYIPSLFLFMALSYWPRQPAVEDTS